MKIYWHSTMFGPSSYSVLTRRTVPELVRLGHEVTVGTWFGLQGEPQRWPIKRQTNQPPGTVMILPTVDGASFGTGTLLASYQRCQAQVCIACMDVWVLPVNVTRETFFCPWLPLDHDPAPEGIVNAIAHAQYPIVYSRWGVEVLGRAGVNAHYVPCSADASLFRPMDRAEARSKVGIPDWVDFLVVMVAANKDPSDRKGFGEAVQGFARFLESHPKAAIYLHTNWGGPVNIGNLLQRAGVPSPNAIRPDAWQYAMGVYDDPFMRTIYAAGDVLLNPAKSEGFGLPILESQMCGTPVALTDYSTTDELLFAGYRIKGQRHWSIGADSWRYLAYVDSVLEALEAAYADRDNQTLRKQARAGSLAYDTGQVTKKYWQPALKEIEEMLTGAGGELKLVTF